MSTENTATEDGTLSISYNSLFILLPYSTFGKLLICRTSVSDSW